MFNVKVDEDTGLENVRFEDYNGRPCELWQSSPYDEGAIPGAATIRLGISCNRMRLDRDLVEELVYRLQVWLRTGSFLDVPKSGPADLQEQPDTPKHESGVECYINMLQREANLLDEPKSEPESQECTDAVTVDTSEPPVGKDVLGELLGKPMLHTAEPPSVADVLADVERVKYALLQCGLATMHDSLCAMEQAIISAYGVDSPNSDPSHMRWDINVENEDGVLKLYIDGETTDGSQRVVRELSVHADGHIDTPRGTFICNLTPGKHEIHRV